MTVEIIFVYQTNRVDRIPFARYADSMKSAAFNKLIADAYTVPEKTVTVYARLLKEAGLLTTGARGRNAPDMKPMDAARITVALLATEKPAEAVEACNRFGRLIYNHMGTEGQVVGCGDSEFSEDLEHFLESFFTAQTPQYALLKRIEVNAQMQQAHIFFSDGKALFDGSSEDVEAVYLSGNFERLQTVRALNHFSLSEIALQFLQQAKAASGEVD